MPYGGFSEDDITLPAAADLSSHQFKFMVVDANGRGTIATDNSKPILGVLQNKPAAQDVPAQIRTYGVSKLKFGAASNENDCLTCNGEGFGTANTNSAVFIGAITLHAPGGSADIQDVVVRGFKY